MWRYKIGDTIQFTSIDPYRIKVSGRTKQFINAFGEELIIENAERAIEIACSKSRASVKDYTAGPIYMNGDESGAHEWLIEFEQKPNDIKQFSEFLDAALKMLNSDYEAKRNADLALKGPVIKEIEKGVFFNWMKSRGKLGGQNKVPRLSNDRRYIEELYKMIN